NRSGHEIEEKFCNRFAGLIRHPRAHLKEPLQCNKKWRGHCDCNIGIPKPPTAEQRECSCDECQKRKRPDGGCPCRLEAINGHGSDCYGRDERKSVAVTNSTDDRCEETVKHRCCLRYFSIQFTATHWES